MDKRAACSVDLKEKAAEMKKREKTTREIMNELNIKNESQVKA